MLGIVCHPINKSTGRIARLCKYECDIIVWRDDSKSLFIEENGGAIHTQEKCKTIKESKPRQEITLTAVHSKLESLSIIVNLERLMAQRSKLQIDRYLDKTLLMIMDTELTILAILWFTVGSHCRSLPFDSNS
ncbi:MAG TPA: hypothetical protein VFX26_06115 [Nitrososphaeraceae archaeon]|nr:hypothetical protein [Nitrososphaeraceae archaeon]